MISSTSLFLAAFAALAVGGARARVTILPNGTVTGLDPAVCATVQNRVDCGYLGITESDCNARGCCWLNTSSSIPSCFYQGEGVPVTKAHILVSNHFDCGYTALANSVISSYHDQFFPLAASVGAALGKNGTAYSWLTQSFIVSLFLDCPTGLGFACPNASQVAAFKASAAAGYVRWHAFPHNAELAMLDPTLLTFGVNLTHAIDDALGVRRKTVLSQRDVPGFPLAAVSPLAAAGVRAFSEGSNAAMLPPAVPPGFVWQDPVDGANVTVMFHSLGYGQLPSQQVERRGRLLHDISGSEHAGLVGDEWNADYLQIPGFSEVIVYAWKSDNEGPPASTGEVEGYVSQVAQWFPNASVVVSDFETFMDAVEGAGAQNNLPLVQADIGDTWLMGVASDPVKTAQYLAMVRQRAQCVSSGAAECQIAPGDSPTSSAFYNFSRLLLKSSEHTWGSTGGVLGNLRTANWSNALFWSEWASGSSELNASVTSWLQQRQWGIEAPLSALPAQSALLQNITAELADQTPAWPANPASNGFQRVQNVSQPLLFLAGGRVHLQLDPDTAAAVSLVDVANNVQWASPQRPLGLYMYQTQSQADIQAFITQYEYVLNSQSWLNDTYGKPGVENFGAQHVDAYAQLQQVWLRNSTTSATVLLLASLNQTLNAVAGAPTAVWLTWTFGANASVSVAGRSARVLRQTNNGGAGTPGAGTSGAGTNGAGTNGAGTNGSSLPVTWEVQIFNKTGTRLPEASYAVFNPAPGAGDPLHAWRKAHRTAADPDAIQAFRDQVADVARRNHPFYSHDEDEDHEHEDHEHEDHEHEDHEHEDHEHEDHEHEDHEDHEEDHEDHEHDHEEDHDQHHDHHHHHGGDSLSHSTSSSSENHHHVRHFHHHHYGRRLHSAYVEGWESVGPLHALWDAVEDASGSAGAGLLARCVPEAASREASCSSDFYRAYRANPHYAVTSHPEVRAALGTCATCKYPGQAREPLVEDRDVLDTWWLSVMGRLQAANDGVAYGGRTLQGTDGLVQYAPLGLPASAVPTWSRGRRARLGASAAAPLIQFESLDAPLARWGYPLPYPTPFAGPVDTASGVAFILHNNAWDTNYIFWTPFLNPQAGDAFKWRFAINLATTTA